MGIKDMNLFQSGNFILNSGISLEYKIDCDALTDKDIETVAKIIYDNNPDFGLVVGIPRGGLRLAKALQQYKISSSLTVLIVDDVITTGKSMEKEKARFKDFPVIGAVIFDRRGNSYNTDPDWIFSVCTFPYR